MDQNPKVFISYTHDSEKHLDLILEISNKLRLEGIDVVLDQYEQSPPQGWPKWMDQNIRDADFVLMVCTENYYKRIMDEEKDGIGLGIKWEGRLIYQHLYNSDSKSKKFIPVLLKKEDSKYIPIPIQGCTDYLINEDSEYDKLYWFLRGINHIEKPELGKLKPLPKKEKRSIFICGFIDVDLWNKAEWRATAFIHDRELKEPPSLGIVFENEEAAKEILKKWLLRLGNTDEYNELRISIIEGEVPGEEPGYTVHIGANIENIIKRADNEGLNIPKDIFMLISRIHRMNPAQNYKNLEIFKERYNQFGSYLLKVGVIEGEDITISHSMYLHKRDIEFREVKDIKSKDDIDAVILPKYRNKNFNKD